MPRIVILIAILAVLFRFGYQEGMLEFGGSFHNGSDSGKYLRIAEGIGKTGEFVWIETRDGTVVATEATDRMPLYPWFLAAIFDVFGEGALGAVVRVQAVIDGLTVIALALAAAAISRRFVIGTALVAAVIPNFLVHSSYVLTETLFLAFFAWGLCTLLWALRGHTTLLLSMAGLCFGAALLTRPVLMFFPLFLLPVLVYALVATGRAGVGRAALMALIPVIVMAAFAMPRVVDNYRNHGHAVLTTQSGNHLTKWVYPCLRTPWTCSSISDAWDENRRTRDARLALLPPDQRDDPYVRDSILREIGKERIRELGIVRIAVGMTVGAIKNTVQTAVYETLTQFRQPPNFLSAMPGEGFGDKFVNFVATNKTNVFMIVWAIAQAGLLLSRVVQLAGLGSGLKDPRIRPYVALLFMTVIYFLAVNGPIANPKYRLPAEPGFIILLVMGWYTLLDWWRARRAARSV